MTERQHTKAIRFAIAGAMVTGAALAMAAHAGADPAAPSPTPLPGQPVIEPAGVGPEAPPAPPPVGPPMVPEIANPVYGGGNNAGNGPLANLRDLWHQAQDPQSFIGGAPDQPLEGAPPPPGAGPAPQLPPGFVSLTDPASNGPPVTKNYAGGPALPPGYYPLNGPPPPGSEGPPLLADPAAPTPPTP